MIIFLVILLIQKHENILTINYNIPVKESSKCNGDTGGFGAMGEIENIFGQSNISEIIFTENCGNQTLAFTSMYEKTVAGCLMRECEDDYYAPIMVGFGSPDISDKIIPYLKELQVISIVYNSINRYSDYESSMLIRMSHSYQDRIEKIYELSLDAGIKMIIIHDGLSYQSSLINNNAKIKYSEGMDICKTIFTDAIVLFLNQDNMKSLLKSVTRDCVRITLIIGSDHDIEVFNDVKTLFHSIIIIDTLIKENNIKSQFEKLVFTTKVLNYVLTQCYNKNCGSKIKCPSIETIKGCFKDVTITLDDDSISFGENGILTNELTFYKLNNDNYEMIAPNYTGLFTYDCMRVCDWNLKKTISPITGCIICKKCEPNTNLIDGECRECITGKEYNQTTNKCEDIKLGSMSFSRTFYFILYILYCLTLLEIIVVTIIYITNWNHRLIKSSGRESIIVLIVGILTQNILGFLTIIRPSSKFCWITGIINTISTSSVLYSLLVRSGRLFYLFKSKYIGMFKLIKLITSQKAILAVIISLSIITTIPIIIFGIFYKFIISDYDNKFVSCGTLFHVYIFEFVCWGCSTVITLIFTIKSKSIPANFKETFFIFVAVIGSTITYFIYFVINALTDNLYFRQVQGLLRKLLFILIIINLIVASRIYGVYFAKSEDIHIREDN